jgi:hypothetical protein
MSAYGIDFSLGAVPDRAIPYSAIFVDSVLGPSDCSVMSREYRTFEVEIAIDGKVEFRTCLNGRPLVGEEIEIDGTVYSVERVRHRQLERRTTRTYLAPIVYARVLRRRRARA